MSKKNTKAAVSTSTKAPAPQKTSRPVAVPALPAELPKLTREQWRALSPEEKRARKEAKRASAATGVAKLKSSLTRAQKMVRNIERALGEEAAAGDARKALALLNELGESLTALPDGWKPTRSTTPTREARFKVGDVVAIAEKRRAAYEGLIADMDALTVERLAGKRAVVNAGGVRLVLPLNMIVPAKPKASGEAEA